MMLIELLAWSQQERGWGDEHFESPGPWSEVLAPPGPCGNRWPCDRVAPEVTELDSPLSRRRNHRTRRRQAGFDGAISMADADIEAGNPRESATPAAVPSRCHAFQPIATCTGTGDRHSPAGTPTASGNPTSSPPTCWSTAFSTMG
ncbi:MAG: hypothetical protein IPP16_11970 [Acidimicrobiaceae bacterium]|nr:hypothetical protein [Acidimicrobiaceae bacterium]